MSRATHHAAARRIPAAEPSFFATARSGAITKAGAASRAVSVALAILLVVAACAPTTEVTPRPTVVRSSAEPSAQLSSGPFTAMEYPVDAEAPCDEPEPPDAEHTAYRGEFRRIRAKDEHTVVFELCDSDAAFLSKIAAVSFAIQDTGWLDSKIGDDGTPAILREVNGTGPYRLNAWNAGSDVTLVPYEQYWGDPPTPSALVFRWVRGSRDRIDALVESTVDGIDDVAPGDQAEVAARADLRLIPREGMNVSYLGFSRTFAPFDVERVRRALASGIDRATLVATAFRPGTKVASHFNPCAIPFGCEGSEWWEFDPLAARDLLTQAGYGKGFTTTLAYAEEPRDYLPDPAATAAEIQRQLKDNLGITATLLPLPFAELTAQVDTGTLEGLYLLGARARYPDASSLLESHFGGRASKQFGQHHQDIVDALGKAASTTKSTTRQSAFEKANNAIRARVPMVPLAHVGSAVGYRADVTEAHASPLEAEQFGRLTPGDRSQFAWMGTREPEGLYCADETDPDALRICNQALEPLYRYQPGDARTVPALATGCKATDDLTVWTCTLRKGVTFHDGNALDANDVVLTYVAQWDAEHPLHRGREGVFRAFQDRFGGFLNPRVAG